MSTFVEKALAIVDRLEAQAKQNEREFGSAFAPLPKHEESTLYKSSLNLELEPKEELPIDIEALKAKIDAVESQLKATLDPRQRALFDKFQRTIAEQAAAVLPVPKDVQLPFEKAQENEDILDIERISEQLHKETNRWRKKVAAAYKARQNAYDEIDSAHFQFKKTLQPEQLQPAEELITLYNQRNKYEQDQLWKQEQEKDEREIKELVDQMSKFSSEIDDAEEPKEILSITLPKEETPGYHILAKACRQTGYTNEYELQLYNQQFHMIRPVNGPAIDFEMLREVIAGVGEELSDPAGWNKVERTSRGVAYQNIETSKSSLIGNIIRDLRFDPEYRENIKQGPYINGIIHDSFTDKMSLDMETAMEAPSCIRVSGQAVKDILVDGFGIQGLDLPPKRVASR